MTDFSQRVREIFGEALDHENPAQREVYLVEACAGDPILRARVDELLAAHEDAGNFLGEAPAPSLPAEGPGTRIGRYRLVEKLGEGGFGVVYLAEQEGAVRRMVALKIIKLGMDTRAVVARFEAERQALARMEHPNIAKVLDGGATESGRPYFVMELVRGLPITRFCDEQRLDPGERVALFGAVCAAVQHAHQKGVIHRDLKPSNILVATPEGRPVPVVIDFGIAKATRPRDPDETELTRAQQLIGTPAYMSPEQLATGERDVDTRSDVYSLGVVLYELLAGRPPFDTATLQSAGQAEIHRIIREVTPPAPSERVATLAREERLTTAERRRMDAGRLCGRLRGDLDRIVLKCLQKDRTRRYETVEALAADLGRFLRHEPVLARPDGWAYRSRKFIRRHRLPVALAALAVLALAGGLAGTLSQAHRAERQRDLAEQQLSRAEAINDLNHFLLLDAAPAGEALSVGDLLARAETVVDRELADSEENRIEMLVTIGRYYWALDRDGKAREVLEKAYARAAAKPELGLRPYAAATLASALARGADLERAEQLVTEALREVDTEPDNVLTRIYCLKCGSEVARERGDTDLGIARAEEAWRLAEGFPRASGLLKLSIAMEVAEAYRMTGRNRDAVPAFARAWTQLEGLGRQRTEKAGTLLNNWGLALGALGRPREAEACFRKAVAIESHDGTASEKVSPLLLNNFARALHDVGKTDEAATLAERALGTARAHQSETVINQTLLNLARIATDRGDLARAEAALQEVAPRLKAVLPEGHYAFSSIANVEAGIALARGDAPGARAAAARAITISEAATQGREYLSGLLLRRAEAALAMQDLAAAESDARRALEIDRGQTPPGDVSCRLGRTWLMLGRLAAARGETAVAREAFRAAVAQLKPTLGEEHFQTKQAIAGSRES